MSFHYLDLKECHKYFPSVQRTHRNPVPLIKRKEIILPNSSRWRKELLVLHLLARREVVIFVFRSLPGPAGLLAQAFSLVCDNDSSHNYVNDFLKTQPMATMSFPKESFMV